MGEALVAALDRFLSRTRQMVHAGCRPGGSDEVPLKNGQRLEVSRRRFRDLLQALEGNG